MNIQPSLTIAMALLLCSGCLPSRMARTFQARGRVVTVPATDRTPQPIADFKVHYQLIHKDSGKLVLDAWPITDRNGEFTITRPFNLSDMDDSAGEAAVKSWKARVSLSYDPTDFADWSSGTELDGTLATEPASDFSRYDLFVLSKQPIALGVAIYALSIGSAPAVSRTEAESWFEGATRIWNQCGVRLQFEQYKMINAELASLPYQPKNQADLEKIRRSVFESDYVNISVTGEWQGAPFAASAAYTNFPNASLLGTVAQIAATKTPTLLAHELGHYFNLLHVDDPSSDLVEDTKEGNIGVSCSGPSNLMWAKVCEKHNWVLTTGQCDRALQAIQAYLPKALRP